MRNHFLCSQCQTYGIGRQCHTSGQKYGIVSQCHTSGIVHPVQTHFNTNQINPLSISQLIDILSLINLLPHKKTNHVKQINSGNMVIVQRQWQQCWTNRLIISLSLAPTTVPLSIHFESENVEHPHTHTHTHTHTYLHTHTGTPDSWYCHMFHVSIKCVPTRRKEVGHSLKPHSGSATIFLWSPFFFNQ